MSTTYFIKCDTCGKDLTWYADDGKNWRILVGSDAIPDRHGCGHIIMDPPPWKDLHFCLIACPHRWAAVTDTLLGQGA